ncbi:hypothetical protein ACT8ZV_01725 [Nocardioides sp. MAHUQ-72]|uniref:hypothetical protein n=1 Tax=unclassified Nocardioides TaxID=2615069 RepID=UPI00361CD0DC
MSNEDPLLLPPGARLLHIGPHKTGSTAIQVSLHEARDALAAHGVHYAGKKVRPRKAVWSIGVRVRPAGTPRPSEKNWRRLVDEVAAAGDQRVCISNEDFGRATPKQIRRIVGELTGDDAHVVAVARRLDRYLPSQWQERVKAGDSRSYDEWLRVVLEPQVGDYSWDRRDPEYSWDRTNVWYAHDTEALVRRWTDVIGPDRFTLIVSDDRDRQLLPTTFERMLGLPAGTLQLFPDRSNRSLTWAEVELVRAVNELLTARGVPRPQLQSIVSRGIVRALQERPGEQSGPRTPPLPDWAAEIVRERSAARLAVIRDLGAHIVGDPDSLMVTDEGSEGDLADPPRVSAATAAAALAGALDRVGGPGSQDRDVPDADATPEEE